MINTFIKLNRRIQEWGWYTNPNTFRVFIHLLIKANYKAKKWEDITIQKGQLVTSHEHIASELKLSRQNVRTALKNLIKTKEIEVNSTKLYSLVTIVNYDVYQGSDIYDNQLPTNDQPSANQQLTTTKEVNKLISEESILTIIDAKDFCLKDEVWINAVKGNYVLTDQKFLDYIDNFTKHATLKGTTSISPKDYKHFFINWYKKSTGKGMNGRKIIKYQNPTL